MLSFKLNITSVLESGSSRDVFVGDLNALNRALLFTGDSGIRMVAGVPLMRPYEHDQVHLQHLSLLLSMNAPACFSIGVLSHGFFGTIFRLVLRCNKSPLKWGHCKLQQLAI